MKAKITLLLSFIILLSITTHAANTGLLFQTYSQQLNQMIPEPLAFHPVPTAGDKYWDSAIPLAMRNDYIKAGEEFLGKEWSPIPVSLFEEYKKNGNRTNYETKSFNLRKQMAFLAMAEIMEHKGRFIKDIVNGLHYFTTETWWGVPAHYAESRPRRDNQTVDLFNAETASTLAWTIYMLHDELEQQERGLYEQMRQEIVRRMLIPAVSEDFSWKHRTNNWNTWICANWLTCVLLCEDNRDRQIDAVRQILSCMDLFMDNYPEDGACDEGITYWDRAPASLFESIQLLSIATNGAIDLSSNEKLKTMASYVYKTYIGAGASVNYGDAVSKTTLHINIAYPFGKYINDTTMTAYAALTAKQYKYHQQPSKLYKGSGTWASLGRELLFLCQYDDFRKLKAAEPLVKTTWMPNSQLFTARSHAGTVNGFFVSAKGGNNGESHNHNDIGNFIVYANGNPLIIDIGKGTYTASTFSDQRYTQFNTRSAYHNVPLINSTEQSDGARYKAENAHYETTSQQTTLSMDLEGAYPKSAKVKKWTRSITLTPTEGITIREDYKLKKNYAPTQLVFISCEEPVKEDGAILFKTQKGNYALLYDAQQLSAQTEEILFQDATVSNAWGKKPLYRTLLTIKGKVKTGSITYRLVEKKL